MNTNAMGRGGVFVLDNVLDVRIELPRELTVGVRLERASPEQIAAIKEQFARLGLEYGFNGRSTWYEAAWSEPSPGQFVPTPLPTEQWRYYVVTFEGVPVGHNATYEVLRATNLVSPALASVCHFSTSEAYGRGDITGRGWFIGGGRHRPFPEPLVEVVDEDAVSRWLAAIASLRALDRTKHEGIHRAVNLYQRLRHMNIADDFMTLGLFMVIEMLLTHNPRDKEIGDSLSHQISTKIPLLSGRMPEPLDYTIFGSEINVPKFWKTLYAYRSCIAHGKHVDFNGSLRALKTAQDAVAFLMAATRKLLRFALEEPKLYDDLKEI